MVVMYWLLCKKKNLLILVTMVIMYWLLRKKEKFVNIGNNGSYVLVTL